MIISDNIINSKVYQNPIYLKAYITICFEIKKGNSYSLRGWVNIFDPFWSLQKLRTFLKLLESEGLISIHNNIIMINESNNESKKTEKKEIIKKPQSFKDKLLTDIVQEELPDNMKQYYDITIAYFKLFEKVYIENNVKTTVLYRAKGKWIDHVKYMFEKDGRTLEQFQIVFKFLQNETENKSGFAWRNVIRSTSTLREKFDEVLFKINQNGKQSISINQPKTSTSKLHEIISQKFGKQ